jgi:hypothetical protein
MKTYDVLLKRINHFEGKKTEDTIIEPTRGTLGLDLTLQV